MDAAAEPTAEPAAEPTAEPIAKPSAEPTAEPAVEPSAEPAAEPSAEPIAEPSAEPTAEPSAEPAAEPAVEGGDSSGPAAVEAAHAPPAAEAPPAVDAEEARQRRIREAVARGEAPIRPEYLITANPSAKRSHPGPDEGASAGKDSGMGQGERAKKRHRGMNKNKDRAGNSDAMKAVRSTQLCSRLAYLNACGADGQPGGGCKQQHDIGQFLASKRPAISAQCPILEKLGVCPAGLNCRFDGHVVDGKNVDKAGNVLSPDSPWATKVPGIGHPTDETNIFSFEMVGQLRKKLFDFSRSQEIAKAWHRHCSGGCETPLGSIVIPERKPLDLRGKRILAPLTTVGNLPFRRLCVKLGCEVTVGEMALASTILEGAPSELALLRRHSSEKCFGVQVAGGDVEAMAKLAQFVDEQVDCDFVDINCGCPLEDVHRRGAGSRLMARKTAMEGIVRCMSASLRTKALTLKMRTADCEDKKSPEFGGRYAHKLVPQLEEWGVSALTLHGRTGRQRYTKLADWDYMSECSHRRARSTPFIGCGDVLSFEEAEEHLRSHGVDSIMIGRGALMKPWLFTELAERRHWDISASERFDMTRDFVNFGLDHWGADARGVETTRRFLLEWLSFTCRYVPIGLLEAMPPKINWRPRPFVGRNDLETKLSSQNAKDWIEISEMLLGKVPEGFNFMPKHKSASYEQKAAEGTQATTE